MLIELWPGANRFASAEKCGQANRPQSAITILCPRCQGDFPGADQTDQSLIIQPYLTTRVSGCIIDGGHVAMRLLDKRSANSWVNQWGRGGVSRQRAWLECRSIADLGINLSSLVFSWHSEHEEIHPQQDTLSPRKKVPLTLSGPISAYLWQTYNRMNLSLPSKQHTAKKGLGAGKFSSVTSAAAKTGSTSV